MNFPDYDRSVPITNDVTIIVNSCDHYKDVLGIFLKSFQEYWPDNEFPLIINNESSPLLAYGEDEKSSKQWGERLIDLLTSITSKYVIIVFDDFLLESRVDSNKINNVLHLLENDDLSSVFYLNAACVKDHNDAPLSDYRLLKDRVDYRLNSVPAIWKREELIRYTRAIDNPWSWEVFGSYRTFGNKRNFYSTSSQSKNIYNYNYKKGGGIYRGKWVREVVEPKIIKYSLEIDLNKRGFVDFNDKVERPFFWKLGFIVLGFKSIGFDMFNFLFRYCASKVKGYINA